MKNPYLVLGITQDASSADIIKACISAMKKKQSPQDIAAARAILANPAKRLAADFTFPVFDSKEGIERIEAFAKSKGIDIKNIDPNKYDSL